MVRTSLWHEVGKGSHVSNIKGCFLDLVSISKKSFLANPVILGVPVIQNAIFHVGRVKIGDNVLVENNMCFPINTLVPSDMTIAVNTSSPLTDATRKAVWVGHHPLRITENVVVPFVPGSVFDREMMVILEVGIIFVPGTFWALTILSWLYLFVFVAFTLDVIPDNAVIQAII